MARVVAIGGIFLRVADTDAAKLWYAEVLGLKFTAWGGVKFQQPKESTGVFSLFGADTTHFDPSTQPAMINFVVEDLDGVLARAEANGSKPLGREDADAMGRFAWLLDPNGFKIELWEPPAPKDGAGA